MIVTELNISRKIAINYCLKTLIEYGFIIVGSKYNQGIISAKKGSTFMSFGNLIEIEITELGQFSSHIKINSESLPFQVFDWGTNQKFESEIITSIANCIQ